MYSVSQVIEQLLVQGATNPSQSDAETICECSIGSLKYNSITNFKYEAQGQCSKKIICHFIATEKHKARISTKHFLRHKAYNEKRNGTKAKNHFNKVKSEPKTPQKNLLEFLK